MVIAEVGRWCNLLEADPDKRRQNLETVTEGLALAEAIGALCCVDIAGSFSPTSWFGPHPDNLSQKYFDAAVENARKIIDAVKPKRARFSYEVMGWALPDSPDSYVKLIKAVDRPAFGVHLDPCNLVNSPAKFYHNTALLNECFDKLGRWIVSCHAKDLTWDVEMNVHFREVAPGKGSHGLHDLPEAPGAVAPERALDAGASRHRRGLRGRAGTYLRGRAQGRVELRLNAGREAQPPHRRPAHMNPATGNHEKNSAALNSVAAAFLLTGLKVVVGLLSGSLGILAEAAHSGLGSVRRP